MLTIRRTNTILYCERWSETVSFYRDGLRLPTTFENDWFVEFGLGGSAYLSVADQSRATIGAGHGAGLTLSWEVPDIVHSHRLLVEAGIDVSPIGRRWGAATLDLFDPEHNRIELWSPGAVSEQR